MNPLAALFSQVTGGQQMPQQMPQPQQAPEQVESPLARALAYAQQQEAALGSAPQLDPSVMTDMAGAQRQQQLAEALMGQGYVQNSGALGALAQVLSAWKGGKMDKEATGTIADALQRQLQAKQEQDAYAERRKAFDEGPGKIGRTAETAQAMQVDMSAEELMNGKKNKPERDPTSILEYERAKTDPQFAAYLRERDAKRGTNVNIQNPGMSLSYDEEGRPVVNMGGVTRPTMTKLENNIIQAEDQLAQLARVGASISDNHLTYEGRVRGAIGGVLDKMGVKPDDAQGGEYVALAADRRAALQGVEQFFNQYRKEITGAAAAQSELEALKKATINADLGPAEFQASYNNLLQSIGAGLRKNVERAGGQVGEAPAPRPAAPAPAGPPQRAVNPETGQTIELRNGQWVPVNE